MAVRPVANNGQTYNFGDLNIVGEKYYIMTSQSDPIDLHEMWGHVAGLSIPIYSIDTLMNPPVSQEAIDSINSTYYWLIGSAEKGGICFCKTSNSTMTGYLVSYAPDLYIHMNDVTTDGKLYVYDSVYRNGSSQNPRKSVYFVINSESVISVVGEHIILHPQLEPPYTLFYSSKSCYQLPNQIIPVQTSWDYIGTSIPFGCSVNNTASDIVTVAGVEVGLYKSPYIAGTIRTEYLRIPFWTFIEQVIEDPFDDVNSDDTDPGGNGTTVDSTPIDFSPLPPDMLAASGIIKMFHPGISEVNAFNNWIYSRPDQVITNLKKIWVNPMESIISLSLVPFAVTDGNAEAVKFCGIDTGLTMPVVGRYQSFDFGHVCNKDGDIYTSIPEEYNSFVSYGGFTKVKIFLPFIGIVDLNTDDVIGADLHLRYNVDLLTGNCVAELKSTKSRPGKKIDYNAVLYQFKGNVLDSVPLSGNNYQQLYSGILSGFQHIAMMQVDPLGSSLGLAGDLISPKVNVQRSGNTSGNSGTLGNYRPYIIIERPPLNIPDNNALYNGYISNKYVQLKNCMGFTQVSEGAARVKSMLATTKEIDMIKAALEKGVIFPNSQRK